MEPRLLPIDDGNLGRLGVPAGLNGMQIQAAQSGLELGAQNLGGNIDPVLGQVADALKSTGGILGTLNNVGNSLNTYQYSQQTQKDLGNLRDKIGGVQGASGTFNAANNNFISGAIELSSLVSTAQGYQNRIGELKVQTDANAAKLAQMDAQSTSLINQFRTTKDPVARGRISDQLKSLQGDILKLQSNTTMAKAEAGALSDALTGIRGEITNLTSEVGAQREQLLISQQDLMRQYGEANQAKETLINNYESFMGRAEAFGYSGMSIDAMKTFSNGLYDYAQGAYGSAGAQFASMTFDFTSLFAPEIASGAVLFKGMLTGIGAGADFGTIDASVQKMIETSGFGSSLDGGTRAWGQLTSAQDPISQLQAGWGLVGNSINAIGNASAIGLGISGAGAGFAPLVNLGTNAMTDAAFWMGSMAGNMFEAELAPSVAATIETMNFINVVDVTPNNVVVEVASSFFSSIENFLDGKLGDPNNKTWREKAQDTLNSWQKAWGGGNLDFGKRNWENGINNMWRAQNMPLDVTRPFSLADIRAFDGPATGLQSFPWSQTPSNPWDPYTGTQTFVPDYTKMWDPNDPFNLDPSKRNDGKTDNPQTEPPSNPDCPKNPPKPPPPPPPPKPQPPQPPQSSGTGTGTIPDGPIPEFNFKLP